jgi:hypothetical protein
MKESKPLSTERSPVKDPDMEADLRQAPQVPTPSRRALRAAALTLALVGKDASRPGSCPGGDLDLGEAESRVSMLPTTCTRPLLIGVAAELAEDQRRHWLIVRLSTDLNPPCFVTFDVALWHGDGIEVVENLGACLDTARQRLWLCPADGGPPTFFLDGCGLQACAASHRFVLSDVARGIATAAAFYRRHLWGGV